MNNINMRDLIGSLRAIKIKKINFGTLSRKLKEKLEENLFLIIQFFICTLCIMHFGSLHYTVSDPLISNLYFLLQVGGFTLVAAMPLLTDVFNLKDFAFIKSFGGSLIRGLAVYLFLLWIVGTQGENIKQKAIESPDESVAVAVGFILLFIMYKFINVFSSNSKRDYKYGEEFEAKAVFVPLSSLQKLSSRDERYIAAHEASHALVYAALGSLPPGFRVVIGSNGDENSLGHVSGIESEHSLNQKSFISWYMLVLLAGQEGEKHLLGEAVLGSSNDHMKWISIAKSYLANSFEGIFYLEPKNEFENKSNEKKINKLKIMQKFILKQLFLDNHDVLCEIMEMLLVKKKLNREEMIAPLSKVVLPTDFPRPLGEVTCFGGEWPADCGLFTTGSNPHQNNLR